MFRSFIYAVVCTLLMSAPAAAQGYFTSENYWQGKTAYDKGDFKTAMKYWLESAEQGVGEAQYFVGVLYHAGQGVAQDYQKARDWYQKSANQEVEAGQIALGALYADGKGIEKDNIRARMWFSLAEINGSSRAPQYIERLDTRMTAAEIEKSNQMAVDWINQHKVRK